MKRIYVTLLLAMAVCAVFALPRVHVIATGGTIAGKTAAGGGHNYDAGKASIESILAAEPRLREYAELDYEQFCNIGSQDMDETVWLGLAKRVNAVLAGNRYDAVIITHGTDTMEETAYFLNMTTHSTKPIILVGSMRPGDAPDADGPANLLKAVQTAVSPDATGREVMCCLGQKIFYACSVFKNDTHAIDAFASVSVGAMQPHNSTSGFDIDNIDCLPRVGIIYGYGGCSPLPLQAFIDAKYDGVVLAGVGMGNFNRDVMDLALQAVKGGMKVVRSARSPYGGVYTDLGEVDDMQCGFIASGSLNPAKARILLMLALTVTTDTDRLRHYFNR